MNFSKDLAAFKEMVAELSDYLLSDAPTWRLSGSSDFPQLSPGSYLLTRARLSAAPDQRAEIDSLTQQGGALLTKWAVTSEKKAAADLRQRVNLWQAYLNDLRESPASTAERYKSDVTQRVAAALLLSQFPRLSDSPDSKRLPMLDSQLRPRFRPGPFLWAAELQPAFPPEEFWFLYGNVKG